MRDSCMHSKMTSRNYVFTKHVSEDAAREFGDDISPAELGVSYILTWDHLWPSDCVKYAIGQLEEGGTTGALHIQGYVELRDSMRGAGVQKKVPFLADAWLQARMGTRDEARAYASKPDTRVYGPAEFGNWDIGQGFRSDIDSLAEMVRSGASNREIATELPGTYLRYARGVEDLRNALEPEAEAEVGFEPRPWQQDILDRLAEDPDDRHIIWVRDSAGGAGKSRLAKHLVLNYGAIPLSGAIKDMAYLYNNQRIAIFDISRAQAEHSSHLYSMAENLKNGYVTSTKYVPKMKRFNPPHVIFFSNSLPEEGKWSQDRIILVDLDKRAAPSTSTTSSKVARATALRFM